MTRPDTATTNTLWLHEVFHRIFDLRDFTTASEFWSEDTVNHFLATGETVRGTTALIQWFSALFAAVPDFTLTVDNTIDDGLGQIVAQWRGNGTFTGTAFQGITPTGRGVQIRGCDVIRLAPDGQVITNTIYYDGAEFARQIGMLPPAGSRADRLLTRAFNATTALRRRLGRQPVSESGLGR